MVCVCVVCVLCVCCVCGEMVCRCVVCVRLCGCNVADAEKQDVGPNRKTWPTKIIVGHDILLMPTPEQLERMKCCTCNYQTNFGRMKILYMPTAEQSECTKNAEANSRAIIMHEIAHQSHRETPELSECMRYVAQVIATAMIAYEIIRRRTPEHSKCMICVCFIEDHGNA